MLQVGRRCRENMAWWLVEEETQRCMHEHSVRCGAALTPPPAVGTPTQLASAATIYDMPLMHMRYGAQGTHQTFSCRAIRHRFTGQNRVEQTG